MRIYAMRRYTGAAQGARQRRAECSIQETIQSALVVCALCLRGRDTAARGVLPVRISTFPTVSSLSLP